jgi:hypothetical protein
MEQTTQSLKELYEKDFYLWVQENLKLLEEKKYDLVDWENLLEEIRCLGEWYVDRVIDLMTDILENLYRWENFRENEDEGHEWIERINNARNELDVILIRQPTVKAKAQEKENIQTAWELAVYSLTNWFEEPKNTLADFPQKRTSQKSALITLNRFWIMNRGFNSSTHRREAKTSTGNSGLHARRSSPKAWN